MIRLFSERKLFRSLKVRLNLVLHFKAEAVQTKKIGSSSSLCFTALYKISSDSDVIYNICFSRMAGEQTYIVLQICDAASLQYIPFE